MNLIYSIIVTSGLFIGLCFLIKNFSEINLIWKVLYCLTLVLSIFWTIVKLDSYQECKKYFCPDCGTRGTEISRSSNSYRKDKNGDIIGLKCCYYVTIVYKCDTCEKNWQRLEHQAGI